jgi:hypothetical protein
MTAGDGTNNHQEWITFSSSQFIPSFMTIASLLYTSLTREWMDSSIFSIRVLKEFTLSFPIPKNCQAHVMIYNCVPCMQVPQDERSIFCEVTLLVILSRNEYMYVCPVTNSFQATAISLYCSFDVHQDALRRATRHVLTRVAKCTDVDCGIFENVLC